MEKIISPKVVSDPIRGIIDIRPVLPMVQTAEFQALAFKYQLGASYMTFPMATHTRQAHSYGAYALTAELTKKWIDLNLISKEEARAVNGFALFHDIGHPAFSHVTEPLCPYDNNEQGLRLIDKLKKEIEACGIDFRLFKDIFANKNPLHLAVHDKNIGTEKLDYLERDGLMTNVGKLSGVSYLVNHIYFINNELVIDPKVIDVAKEVQDFYIKMYKSVYLRKKSVIAQRMMQKMAYALIKDGSLKNSDLMGMRDFELLGKLQASKNPLVERLFSLFMNNNVFKETIVLRHKEFTEARLVAGKPINVFGVDAEIIERFIASPNFQEKNPEKLLEMESTVAEFAGIPPYDVLIAPIVRADRFKGGDIKIYSPQGPFQLKTAYPAHYKNMEEYGRSYAALRVCVPEEYRARLAEENTAKKIFDKILSLI